MKALIPLFSALPAIALLSGCGSEVHQQHSTTDAGGAVIQAVSLPADLFSDEPIPNASSLLGVKESAGVGDEVSFVAAIGGRANPFVDGRAVMIVSDLDLAFCTDGCPIPWDACCALPEDIARHTATVQVVDETGNPLRVGMRERLKAGSEIQVSGVVSQAGGGGYVINAHRMHIAH